MEEDREAGAENGRNNPAASSDAPASPRPDDEDLRRYAVARLADHLEVGVSLAQRCEHLAAIPKGDRIAPVIAAARLMNASAAVAEALGTLALVERRRRSIVERIQPPDPKQAELNSRLHQEEVGAETRLKIYNRMNEHIEESIRARMGEEGAKDSVSWLIKKEKETLARLRGEEVADDEEDDPGT
jgi:hypothetical protein